MNLTTVAFIGIGLVGIWCVVLTIFIAKEKQILRDLARGVTKKDLLTVLRQLSDSLLVASQKIEANQQAIEQMRQAATTHFQKSGFVRFNPFSDTGGDQSFSFCLLDHQNNGIVITSLHSRNTTRLYAKQVVDDGVKRDDFSDEEWQALQAARNTNQK